MTTAVAMRPRIAVMATDADEVYAVDGPLPAYLTDAERNLLKGKPGATMLLRHPLSALFPAMSRELFARLRLSVRDNGLFRPVIRQQHVVADGWNRVLACLLEGVPLQFEELHGPSALARCLAENLYRRHLSQAQLAMVGARLYETANGEGGRLNQRDVQQITGVGETAILEGVRVLRSGVPQLAGFVDAGTLSLKHAGLIAKLDRAEQLAVVAGDPDTVTARAKAMFGQRPAKRGAATPPPPPRSLAPPPTAVAPPPPPPPVEATPPPLPRPSAGTQQLSRANALLNECIAACQLLRVKVPLLLSTPEGQRFGKYVKLLGLSSWFDADGEFVAAHPVFKLLAASVQPSEHPLNYLRSLLKD